MPGIDAEHAEHAGGDGERARRREHLLGDLAADVVLLADARDDHRRGDRDQQRRDLRDQPVADREQDVAVGGLRRGQVVLGDADDEAADHVDDEDQEAGDRVAAHELAGAVHRAEELGFLADLGAAALGLLLVDQAGVQVGVDRHLLAGHRVEREARADFGDALGALGHDDEVDDDEDREHDQADREVAADQEVAERLDHLAGRGRAGVAVQQHDARRGDVERQAQQRRQQEHRREHGEVERPHHVGRDHHHHQRQRDVEGEQQVERERRQRQHHHREDHHDDERRHQRAHRLRVRAEPGAASVAISAFMERSCLGMVVPASGGRGAGRARPGRRAPAARPACAPGRSAARSW